MGFIKALFGSRKFWLTVSACVGAVLTGQPQFIPAIIMAEVGAIAAEDVAQKIGEPAPAKEK